MVRALQVLWPQRVSFIQNLHINKILIYWLLQVKFIFLISPPFYDFFNFWPIMFNDILLRMDLPLSYSSTWLLKSMYAAHELNFQLLYDTVGAATYWHIWHTLPRNRMAGALDNWYWPLTTRSCGPSRICVRGGCCCCNEPIWRLKTMEAPKIEVIKHWI